jgi:hypothetical protein
MVPKLYRTCKRYQKKEEEIEEALADASILFYQNSTSSKLMAL